jgi:DNA-binding protein HU-beta
MAGRDQLVQATNEKLKAKGLEPIKAEQVDTVFETIVDLLKSGDKVGIQHFGSFIRRLQMPRTARNPQTGTPIEVPARVRLDLQTTVPAFELNEEEQTQLKKQLDAVAAAKAKAAAAPTPAAKPAKPAAPNPAPAAPTPTA